MFFRFHAALIIFALVEKSKLLQSTQYANVRLALFFSLLLCILTGLFLWWQGKVGSFLLINQHYTTASDIFFRYATFLGDGLIYIPLFLYCMFLNRGFFIPAVLSILVCLLLTHFLKRIVFPDMLRPLSLEAHGIRLHKIQGVYMNRTNSFPSGHTATAFATAVLLAAVFKKKALVLLAVLLAFLVAYSRVYLAQHFVSDVLGGMVIGVVTAVVSLWLQPIIVKALPLSVRSKIGEPRTR